MSADYCYTESPEYILKKEYEGKPDISKLYEIFVLVYKVDLPKYKIKKEEDTARYLFFHSLEKAFKRWKLFGPRGAILQRVFTDDDELNELASKNDNIEVNDEEENDEEEDEEEKNEDKEEEVVEEKKEIVV
jgi:Ran GTPase-activating protein (RanGAP) involved in mRNA processing and transport